MNHIYTKRGRQKLSVKRKPALWGGVVFVFMLLAGVVTVQYYFLTQQGQAMVTGQSGQVKVNQSNYRLYEASSAVNPGAPLAASNMPATLARTKNSFRVRVGVENQSLAFRQISTNSWNHTCGVNIQGKVLCWGEGIWGALGSGSASSSLLPAEVDTSGVLAGKTARQIATGDFHTCMIASDNQAYCWGWSKNGELGHVLPAPDQVNSPVAVSLPGKTLTNIVTGNNHSCALDTTGKLYCWGSDGANATHLADEVWMVGGLAGKTVTSQIAAGQQHTCFVASDNLPYCWGNNDSGQLGNGTTTLAKFPGAVTMSGALAGKTVKLLSTAGGSSSSHTCFVASDNLPYCWGNNDSGQLGNGTTANSSVPVAVSLPAGLVSWPLIKQITTGASHTCATTTDDRVYCWGKNAYGELGDNSTVSSSRPVAAITSGALAGKAITQISIGIDRSCVLASDNQVYCWGKNDHGQFGNNSTTNSIIPIRGAIGGASIVASSLKLKVQYAEKTAATCSAVAAGWQDITNSSALAYSPTGPNSGAAIAAEADDPVQPAGSLGYSYQSIVRGAGNFTNNRTIPAGETGLWDLALTDLSLKRNTDYCVRLVTDTAAAPGTSIDGYPQYPEFRTSDGSLDIRFADGANATLNNPTTSFSAATTSSAATSTTAQLSNNLSQQLEVSNTLSHTGWNVTLAPTAGAGAKWTQVSGTAQYGFNNTSVDQGQLTVDLSAGAFAASGTTPQGQSCTSTGLSFGAGGTYITGTATASTITLANASSNTGLNCVFKLQNIGLKQTIPANQSPGTYILPVTVTVTAQ